MIFVNSFRRRDGAGRRRMKLLALALAIGLVTGCSGVPLVPGI